MDNSFNEEVSRQIYLTYVSELRKQHEGIALEEVAALNNVSLVYEPLESGSARSFSDGRYYIFIDHSIRKAQREEEFYGWLSTIIYERENGLEPKP